MGTATPNRKYSTFSQKSIATQIKRDQFIRQWLSESAKNNSTKMLEMLKDQPCVVKERDPFSGFTALHWAAKHGNSDMVIALIKTYGQDVHEKSHGGYTALHLASKYRHPGTCKILVTDLGANINIRDNYGKKPNYYTIKHDHQIRQQYSVKENKDVLKTQRSLQSNDQITRFISLDEH